MECGLNLYDQMGGRYGLWTRCFALATWRSAANNHFVSAVLAPLNGVKARVGPE